MSTENTVYHPRSLAQIFSNFFITPEEKKMLQVRGAYCDKKGVDYYGNYYDRLKDETSGDILTIKIPALLKSRLKDGRPYIFEGFIDRRTSNNINKELNIYLTFVVTKVVSEETPMLDAAEYEKAEIFRSKSERGFRNIDTIIRNLLSQGRRPKLALIYGKTAITDDDVISATGAELDYYEIILQKISMANKEEMIEALDDLGDIGGYDLIALVRGGGAGLEIFDEPEIARAVANMGTPVITAIGHANDHRFVQVVADRAFNTPTALGDYLKRIARSTFQEIAEARAFVEREKQYQQQIVDLTKDKEGLQKENKELYQRPPQVITQQKYPVGWLVAGLIIGAIIMYLLLGQPVR